jgi:hypothetical protein
MLERIGTTRPIRLGRSRARPPGRWLAALGAAAALAGCSATAPLFSGDDAALTPSGEADGTVSSLAVYLDLMRRLIEGDALTRAETFSDAENAADFAPTTTNRLRYALALSVPGHAGSDAEAAAMRLRTLLAASDVLLAEERILATMQLRAAEQLTVLRTANANLRQELETTLAERDAANAERVNALLEENRRLQSELEDATERLDAITNIEQSINERGNGEN